MDRGGALLIGEERGLSLTGGAFFYFYLTRPLLLGDFRKSSPVPFFTLKEGAPPLPRLPLLRRGLQPVNRLFCTRKQALAPSGVLVEFYAIELRLFDATLLRLSKRLWRPCGLITWLISH